MWHLIFLIISGVTFATGVPIKDRIWGGQNATSGQFPFAVAFNDPTQFCNGIIIAPSWILTAAHCLANLSFDAEVYVGSPTNHINGTAYTISQTVMHELYNETDARNDIGLARINGTLEYNENIQTIEIGDYIPNTTCTAIGWGESISEAYPPLQYIELTAIDITYCSSFISDPPWMVLGPEQMCALGDEREGTCFDDDGGPLVCDGRLAGVLSVGILDACGLGFPTVYTRAAAFVDWIQTNVNTI